MGERFPNNSSFNAGRHTEREVEKREPEAIKKLDSPAMKIKTPLSKKFMDTFVQGDISDVVSHIIHDILIPSAIETIGDMGHNLVDGMIYGDDAPRRRNRRYRTEGRSSLDRTVGTRGARSREQMVHNRRSLRFDDIALNDYDDAEAAIAELRMIIEEYNRPATVTDLYSIISWDNYIDHTTDRYGWYQIDKRVRPIRIWVDGEEKWTINLPKAEYLDD